MSVGTEVWRQCRVVKLAEPISACRRVGAGQADRARLAIGISCIYPGGDDKVDVQGFDHAVRQFGSPPHSPKHRPMRVSICHGGLLSGSLGGRERHRMTKTNSARRVRCALGASGNAQSNELRKEVSPRNRIQANRPRHKICDQTNDGICCAIRIATDHR